MPEINESLLQLVQQMLPSAEERAQQAAAFDSVRQLLQVGQWSCLTFVAPVKLARRLCTYRGTYSSSSNLLARS